MTETTECVVAGAGVVGLAIARALALSGREVVVLDAGDTIGGETSSRNNEVLHSGFLYPPNSLRGRLCRRGRDLTLRFCEERGVEHAPIGKLMPAVAEDEVTTLRGWVEQGRTCGVDDLEILDADAARRLEPQLACRAALFSPSTEILDSHAFMLALQGDAENDGAAVILRTRVVGGTVLDSRFMLVTEGTDGERYELTCRTLINAAGLGAHDLAAALAGFPHARIPEVHWCKGNFLSLSGPAPFTHLVVPLGTTLAKGGAFTLDIAGRGKFGPDQQWVTTPDYDVDPGLADSFAAVIGRYWPNVEAARLGPDYAGIRPRCWGRDDPPGDWIVAGPRDHGVTGLVNLFGIETPGLTTALALADFVVELLAD